MQYVYLICEREFIGKNVYKVGKTIQDPTDRMKAYPKGSVLICAMNVNNCHVQEKKLKRIFKQQFKQRTDIGIEYFEGDMNSMLKIFKNTEDIVDPEVPENATEYQILQQKAKVYHIKANLSREELEKDIKLYEKGKANKIPKDHFLKDYKLNVFQQHKKKFLTGGGVCAIIIIAIIILSALSAK